MGGMKRNNEKSLKKGLLQSRPNVRGKTIATLMIFIYIFRHRRASQKRQLLLGWHDAGVRVDNHALGVLNMVFLAFGIHQYTLPV